MKKLYFNFSIILLIFLSFNSSIQAQMTFVHPGGVNGQAELDFVKAKIAANAQPWKTEFDDMVTLATAVTNFTAPTDENGQKADARKAYANALAWYYTGNVTYANNAIGVLNVWGNTFTGYPTTAGQDLLQGGWIGAMLGPAAEIMRGYVGWNLTDRTKVINMFKNEFYPVLNTMSTWNGNVDLTQIDAMMNIAVFCEDETEFNLGISRLNARNPIYFYLTSEGTPSNSANWFSPTSWVDGLTQETCRDNGHHAQYAMASALHAAEVAWNQGVDLYTPNQARYTATLELIALQINSGLMQGTCSNNIASTSLYATWEVGYNHYYNRKGISLPNTLSLLTNKIRPNGVSDWNIFYETLTHNLDGSNKCPKPTLGADQSICGQSGINLNSGLTTIGKTFSWYKDNVLLPLESSPTLSLTTAGVYKVIVDSINCSFNDEVVINGTININLGGDKELCNPIMYTLDAGNAGIVGVTYLWNTGETTKTITAAKEGNYSVTVGAPGCSNTNASINITSKLVKVIADTICTSGVTNLEAIGTSTYNWYSTSTNGSSLFTGNLFSPTILSNTTYYVEETSGYIGKLGKLTRGAGDKWNITGADFGASDKINKVTVSKSLILKSLAVYVESANATVVINFKQGATVIHTKSFSNLSIGKQTLLLDFNLNPGTYIIDALGSTGTLSFEASGATFPYNFSYPGYISFTYNENWQNAWYGFFYDWTISTNSPCLRTEVKAIIDNSNPNCVINGLGNASNSSFDLYPNPAKDKLALNLGNGFNENNILLHVNNSFGQLVYSSNVTKSDSEIIIDVSQFLPGVYYFKINNIVRKVVVQH